MSMVKINDNYTTNKSGDNLNQLAVIKSCQLIVGLICVSKMVSWLSLLLVINFHSQVLHNGVLNQNIKRSFMDMTLLILHVEWQTGFLF